MNKKSRKIERKVLKKFRNHNQHEESGAGGFQPMSDMETQQIVTQKLVERIQMQGELFKLTMLLSRATAEHEEMETIYELYGEGNNGEVLTNAMPKPKWYGIPFTKKLWLMEMNCKMVDIRNLLIQRNILHDRLKSVGFTDKEFDRVMKGEFVKDMKELEALEKAREDELLDKVDALDVKPETQRTE